MTHRQSTRPTHGSRQPRLSGISLTAAILACQGFGCSADTQAGQSDLAVEGTLAQPLSAAIVFSGEPNVQYRLRGRFSLSGTGLRASQTQTTEEDLGQELVTFADITNGSYELQLDGEYGEPGTTADDFRAGTDWIVEKLVNDTWQRLPEGLVKLLSGQTRAIVVNPSRLPEVVFQFAVESKVDTFDPGDVSLSLALFERSRPHYNQVSAGALVFAVESDGELHRWSNGENVSLEFPADDLLNWEGDDGTGSGDTVRVSFDGEVRAVSHNSATACVITGPTPQTVQCFEPDVAVDDTGGVSSIVYIDTVDGAPLDVAAADAFVCALLENVDGVTVQCWENNDAVSRTTVEVGAAPSAATFLSAHGGTACAVTNSSAAYCWSDLTSGATQLQYIPEVGLPPRPFGAEGDHELAQRVGTGPLGTCVVTQSARLFCAPSVTDSMVEVPWASGAVEVAVGTSSVCVLRMQSVFCAGLTASAGDEVAVFENGDSALEVVGQRENLLGVMQMDLNTLNIGDAANQTDRLCVTRNDQSVACTDDLETPVVASHAVTP